ncbi:FAD binding domain-containing protein [Clostridium chrysemydis]|uniref:FAD binding domain-containing protein n=1 Tax=Clostridium chrysemydis TaxID=2665504 RepID=UPI0018839692|nr:FAD binding domain-containing protein [Clostridium chrysemydis]
MFNLKELYIAKDLNDAYDTLVSSKNNCVIGGGMWLKMSDRAINKGIDLSNLNLNYIKEEEDKFIIGSMTSLRDIENSKELNLEFRGYFKKFLKSIVGTQFRNTATIGGSVYSKFGFSDISTGLLGLDTYVELFRGGIVSLEEFNKMKLNKDILVNIIIYKNENLKAEYESLRLSKTDLPLINVAVSYDEKSKKYNIVVGARPNLSKRAVKASEIISENYNNLDKGLDLISSELDFGKNMRGSKEYREESSKILVKRCILKIMEDSYENKGMDK